MQCSLTFIFVRFIVVGLLIVVRNSRYSLRTILVPDQNLVHSSRFLSLLPPTSNNHHAHVDEVKPHEDQRLPQEELTVPKDSDNQSDGDEEEPDVSQEWVFFHLEGPNDAHGTHHAAHNEGSSPEQLPNRQAADVGPHGREGREHIRTAVSEREKRYSGDAFVQTEGLSNCGEIWTEEVGSAYADCREEESEPSGKACEDPWSSLWFCAEVSLDIMNREEGIGLRTLLLDMCALILEGQLNGSTLMM